MTMFGIIVLFLLGAVGGVFYGAMACLGLYTATGMRDSPDLPLSFDAGGAVLSFMLLAPVIGIIVLAFNDRGPIEIGFSITASATIGYVLWGIYKRVLLDREDKRT